MMKFPRFEDSQTEFKQESVHNVKIAKEICAFANLRGGTIYFGLSDQGEVIGIDDPQRLEEKIMAISSSSIHPSIIPFVSMGLYHC